MEASSQGSPAAGSRWTEFVRTFPPGWFAAVMGTGVLALTARAYSEALPPLASIAVALHWANVALFIALAVPWLARWIRFPEAALATLRHPVHAHFYPTFSIALLVLAVQCLAFGGPLPLAYALWVGGTALTLAFSIVILAIVFESEMVALEHVSPGMFIPPVGLVVIPVAGAPLAAAAATPWREWLLMVNWVALGAGLLLYLGLAAITLHRFMLHKRLAGPLAATVWFNLGPLGVVPLSLANLAAAMPALRADGALHACGLILWGCGAWWLAMAIVFTLRARRRGELPFALSWWAFTFPLGAFAAASHRLGTLLGLAPVYYVGFAALALLAALWTITLVKTARGLASGALTKGG